MGVGAGSAPGRHPPARSSRAPARPAIVRAHCPHPPLAAGGIAALALGDGDLDGDRGGFVGRGGTQGGLINRPSWRLGLSGSGGEADSTC